MFKTRLYLLAHEIKNCVDSFCAPHNKHEMAFVGRTLYLRHGLQAYWLHVPECGKHRKHRHLRSASPQSFNPTASFQPPQREGKTPDARNATEEIYQAEHPYSELNARSQAGDTERRESKQLADTNALAWAKQVPCHIAALCIVQSRAFQRARMKGTTSRAKSPTATPDHCSKRPTHGCFRRLSRGCTNWQSKQGRAHHKRK
jgi:hypothetical protein